MLQRQIDFSTMMARASFFYQDKEDENTFYLHTAVVGGGPSGLTSGYMLKEKGVLYSIFERGSYPGSSWDVLPDGVRLVMPVGELAMPGLDTSEFEPNHHLTRDEMLKLLKKYADNHALNIQYNTNIITILQNQGQYRFILKTSAGTYLAENIIICTGPRDEPKFPHFVDKINRDLVIHSADYRNPSAIKIGLPVLVVGGGLSAYSIVTQLKNLKYRVLLASGHDDRQVKKQNKHLFFTETGQEKSSDMLNSMLPSRFQDINLGKLVDATAEGELIFMNNGKQSKMNCSDFAKLIFATGYRQYFPFLMDLPGMTVDQFPSHQDGVVPSIPGLYFVGIPSLHHHEDEGYSQTVLISTGSRQAKKTVEMIMEKNKCLPSLSPVKSISSRL